MLFANLFNLAKRLDADCIVDWSKELDWIKKDLQVCTEKKTYPHMINQATQICTILVKHLKNDLISFENHDAIHDIIMMLVRIGNEYNHPDEYPSSSWDSLTISINGINGESFHALLAYTIWYASHNQEMEIEQDVKRRISDYIDGGQGGHSVSRHAMLGLYFVTLYTLDGPFMQAMLYKFPKFERTFQIAFWDAYVGYSSTYRIIFDEMKGLYQMFANERILDSLQIYHKTLDHIVLAYIYGFDKADKIFEQCLENANEMAIDHCISKISQILAKPSDSAHIDLDRLAKLWKNPLCMRHDLSGWVASSPFSAQITIKMYKNFLEQYTGRFDIFVCVGILKKFEKRFPKETMDCMNMLFEKWKRFRGTVR